MHWSLSDSAVQLACLFCTTLAPISGLLRLALWGAGRLSPLLGGALYRHAGGWNEPLQQRLFRGLVAIVLYPLIIDIFRHRRPTLTDRDYFDPVEHDEPLPPPDRQEMTEERDH